VLCAALSFALPAAVAMAAEPVSGAFHLVDHSGTPVTEHSYEGKLRLVFFGFTRCPYVCPTTLVEVAGALRQLGDAAAGIQPLFITVDPGNDSPAVLSDYVAAFHPAIVGLTGSEAQVAEAARAFNVAFGTNAAVDGASLPAATFHSAYLYLMDREGRFIDVMGSGARAAAIADALREYL